MNTSASRRGLLAGIAAAPVLAPAVPVLPAAATPHPDAELLRLGASLREAWAADLQSQADLQGREDHEAELAWDALSARISCIVKEIAAMQAATLDGLSVKALAASWCYPDEPFGHEILEARAATDTRLAVGIVRDLIAMGAPDPALGRVGPDPIFAVIAESRRLLDAWTEANKLPLDGLNPGPEAQAASSAFHAHCDDVLLRTVPQTAAGCAALARYAHDFALREGWTLDESDEGSTDHLRILDLIARSPMLAVAPAGDDARAQAVADAIEKLWPEWAALCEQDWRDLSPEADQRGAIMHERRMALIKAAEALPATCRAARYAKALAFAWYEHVGLWTYGRPLSEYGADGRLVLDIEASLTGAPAWTGAQS